MSPKLVIDCVIILINCININVPLSYNICFALYKSVKYYHPVYIISLRNQFITQKFSFSQPFQELCGTL